MIQIDLLTGFLGSGKTTFIKKYVTYLVNKGYKIGIIENDYGAINVDMMLLQDVMGDRVSVEMIAGGSDLETHMRRFKTKLIALAMQGFDRVIVEPSGIYDVDEFFDVLYDKPLDKWYEIGNVISVVDAKLQDMSEESDYLLCSQIATAGKIVISKSQLASQEDLDHTISHMKKALEMFKCTRQLKEDDFITKDWNVFTDEDLEMILHCGYVNESHLKRRISEDNDYQSLFFMNKELSKESILDSIKKIMNDPECGNVIRIKGFINDQGWYEINATKEELNISPIENGQDVIILIGEHLSQEKIEHYL